MHQIPGPLAGRVAAALPVLVFRTVLQGTAHLAWRNRRVRLDEDAWLVLDAHERCSVQIDPALGTRMLVVAVTQADRQAALAIDAAGPADGAFADNLRSSDGPAGRRLAAIARGRAAGRPEASERGDRIALVCEALAEERALRDRAARIACVKLATREQLLRRILLAADFIASRHDEPLSLDEMARAASLSRFHFVRLFSLVHGETPHAFLLKKRTAVARRHLAVGSACSEAATRAGFGSRSALFRNLRKTHLPISGHEPCCLSA